VGRWAYSPKAIGGETATGKGEAEKGGRGAWAGRLRGWAGAAYLPAFVGQTKIQASFNAFNLSTCFNGGAATNQIWF